ncbi:2187_t:CDS:1 [Diversispora eburnea]|uniref:2187_t:CDS:1 n=1 Tax=Diversispora eburnea TaxID=1213867 RepID=A0A9N8Z8I1_9GLOM|nr:2187_t:CDS:1 [Diversispora eburnea]
MTKKNEPIAFSSKIIDSLKSYTLRHLENETNTKIFIDYESLNITIRPKNSKSDIGTARYQIEEMLKIYYRRKYENSIALRREKNREQREIRQLIDRSIENYKDIIY